MRAALNGAPCAVAIAPAGYRERPRVLGEIGVGYDGSPESESALAVARELAALHGASVSAFQAVTPWAAGLAVDVDAEVEQARRRLASLGDLTPHAAYGDAADELALYGASVDLLVVGSRGYGPLGRLIHGSTTMRLAHRAQCPLLVLPRSSTTARIVADEATAEPTRA